jgi:hypothetical protein
MEVKKHSQDNAIRITKQFKTKTMVDRTLARRIYSRINGLAGCSNESSSSVSGDAVSRRLSSFDISSKLWVRRCERLVLDGIFSLMGYFPPSYCTDRCTLGGVKQWRNEVTAEEEKKSC